MVVTVTMMAIPAKRGQWKTLTLQDGTEVRATLVGDEHGHFWKAENGQAYIQQGDVYVAIDAQKAIAKAKARRAKVNAQRVQRRTFGHPTTILGHKKAIMILVNFKDKSFQTGHDNALFNRIANEEGFSEGNFKGSMADYFKAQSGGKFILDFDVAGPVMMSQPYDYYGNNDEKNISEMVIEACKGVQDSIDFSRYDWDGDGEAEEVFILYAGYGQNDYDASNDSLIWPLMSALEEDRKSLKINGTKINTYACSSELKHDGKIAGIGTFCHEFSHCMGFPDVYDVQNKGSFAMDAWDLMDYGNYNGDGYLPAGYTAYEKMVCGWLTPVELGMQSLEVTDMKPLADGGQAYLIRHPQYENEYFLLENRQPVGFDKLLPGSGVLITHVDYDKDAWEANAVNTLGLYNGYYNDHLRLALVPADGIASISTIAHDTYPYGSRNKRQWCGILCLQS